MREEDDASEDVGSRGAFDRGVLSRGALDQVDCADQSGVLGKEARECPRADSEGENGVKRAVADSSPLVVLGNGQRYFAERLFDHAPYVAERKGVLTADVAPQPIELRGERKRRRLA
jgi:hypothetical protein